MRRVAWLTVMALAFVLAACGPAGPPVSEDGQPLSTETPRSERTERDATEIQEQRAEQPAEAQVEQIDAPPEETHIAGATAVGEIDFGHREGLPYLRNSVGDPDAPVVIVEYSDFQ